MNRTARFILFLSEVLTFNIIALLIIFILYFLQMNIKTGYMETQKQDISKVDMIIKSFVEKKYYSFREFGRVPDVNKLKATVFMEGFSDLYYLDRGLKIRSIFMKEPQSAIFRGYDFSTSRAADFFRSVKSATPEISGMFESQETESRSFYVASITPGGILVGRVDIALLTGTLKWFGEFSSSIMLLATGEGYVLSKTSDRIDMQILPNADFSEIELDEKYLLSSGRSQAMDCRIAILTPVSSVYGVIESIKKYYPLFAAVIIAVMLGRLIVSHYLFLKPLEKFISVMSGWNPGEDRVPASGFFFGIHEINVLYKTFSSKSEQVISGIDELKQKERQMQGMRNYLKKIINSMPSIMISTDCGGVVREWNDAAYRFTGVTSDDAAGRPLFDVFPELRVVEEQYKETLVSSAGFECKRSFARGDNVTEMKITAFPLSQTGNEGVVIRLDDITVLERAEESLRQAQKMEVVATLAGGIVHDFNNIQAGIQGSVSILKLKTTGSSDLNQLRPVYEKYFGFLEQSSEKSTEVISRLLTLSRQNEPVFSIIDLNDILKTVGEMCVSSLDKSVKINTALYSSEAPVRGDSAQLEQALINLCVNGAHAMTIMKRDDEVKGGLLSLSLGRIAPDQFFLKTHPESSGEYEYWKLSVKDEGTGMTREVLAGMYDPFFTTKGKRGGAGLGLTMVYNIVHSHGGFIDVYTEKGKGSEFIVYLPVIREGVERMEPDSGVKIRKGTGTILVIDDEEVIRKVSQELLGMSGFRVIEASDGNTGLDIYKRDPDEIRLVILDIIMPVMSGVDTYRELKKINPDIRVLLTSGYRNEEKIQECVDLGVNGFIQKPYTLQRLSDAVFKILED